MSNIDMSRLVTASEKSGMARAARLDAVKAACRARILDVLDAKAQINLTAAAAAGVLSEADMRTFRDGLGWIMAMRRACGALIDNDALEPEDDANWPALPAGIAAMAAEY